MDNNQTNDAISNASSTAADVVSHAAQTAKDVIEQAAQTAQIVLANEATITQALTTALREVFGENTTSGRFVDVSRIPLICKSIIDMHDNLKEMNNKLDNKFVTAEAFSPVKNIVYGLVTLILIAVVGALVALVLKK